MPPDPCFLPKKIQVCWLWLDWSHRTQTGRGSERPSPVSTPRNMSEQGHGQSKTSAVVVANWLVIRPSARLCHHRFVPSGCFRSRLIGQPPRELLLTGFLPCRPMAGVPGPDCICCTTHAQWSQVQGPGEWLTYVQLRTHFAAHIRAEADRSSALAGAE